ncbi:MAG: carotenoid biosynthesis protein [Chloroflexota bacterium]|nr:carotenoid biosynthesis protein [Chloroflexota bacterium]
MRRRLPPYLAILCLGLALSGYFAVRFPDVPGTGWASTVSTLLIALPAMRGAIRRFGWRGAAVAIGLLAGLGFGVELTGVVTGFPYGEFYYSDSLGAKVAGLVPVTLPLSWVPLILGAVAATEPRAMRRTRFGSTLWALAAAVLLVAVDSVLDPGAAHLGFWVWPHGGGYYGVPLTNYLGWALSSVLAVGLLLAVLPWRRTEPVPAMLDSALVSMAFWTAVALFSGLWVPFVLGVCLFFTLIWRRASIAATSRRKPKARWVQPFSPVAAADSTGQPLTRR